VDFQAAFFQGPEFAAGSWEDLHVWLLDPEQPEGITGDRRRVRKLRKDVPGLRRAAQSWYLRLRAVLLETGHVASKTDPALYLFKKNNEIVAYFPTHVDDGRGKGTKWYVDVKVKGILAT
jgi:hypothetical protein